MKRFKYNLNSQNLQDSNFGELVTIGVVPVVPGDTVSGKSQVKLITESVTKMIMNRTYHDVFAFYIPHRLVWDEWPEYIAGLDGPVLPVLGDETIPLQKMCCIQNVSSTQSIGGIGQVNAFGVRAYNLIWNKFFRTPTAPEVGLNDTAIKFTPLRSTTLNQRLKDELTLQDELIDSSGPTISTGDIRTAFSQDRFNKTRAYYGDKYTDYLAALGVEASWSILDEPELVGMSQKALKFVPIDSTSELDTVDPTPGVPDTVGSVGGRWEGTNMLNIRKTFAPEHGVIMIMGTVRMELEPLNQKGCYEYLKADRDQFYSPEFETERKQAWKQFADPVTEVDMYLEKYDDYRNGMNYVRDFVDPALLNPAYISMDAIPAPQSTDLLYPSYSRLNQFLNDQYAGTQINLSIQHRIHKVSPVRPAQSVHGVS